MGNITSKPRGTPWKPGESGNPAGRPKGSRNAFSAVFVGDLTASWSEHGPAVLDQVARRDPSRYLGVCATVIPRDVAVSIEQRAPGNLDPADWAIVVEVMNAVKAALPDANARRPGEVMQFVADAIRAHSATLITTT
jgi:hypothetical protein